MTDNNDKIHIIATGGTIDAHFSPKEYKPVPNQSSIIEDFIKDFIKPHFEITTTTVSMIDSLYMTEEIRTSIVKEINKTKHSKILITHGTDGMIDTARLINNVIRNKTVVLTGSMIPLKGFSPSDAGFNLGFSIGSLLNLPIGVFIAMNGKIFETDNVIKNLEKSRFEET